MNSVKIFTNRNDICRKFALKIWKLKNIVYLCSVLINYYTIIL